MRAIGFVFLINFIFLCACSHKTTNHSSDKTTIEISDTNDIVSTQKDTCFCSVEELRKVGVKLVWGYGAIVRTDTLKNLFYYQKLFCNDERQVLNFACGSPCDALVILPNNMVDSIQVIYNPISHSEKYDFVIGASSQKENELIIYDINNRIKRNVMVEMKDCESTFYIYCLDLEFEGDSCFTVKTTEGNFFRWNLNEIFNDPDGIDQVQKK